ncbi:Aste57867_18817 [Aphanomyces stellatus]|uniref:Aste57867_18817 protein n=1 Tax=Aphanomyces stellatus TaxID=120398 RepID=A0A485LFB9_9STRA|nr:hypothetical protein As57867_018753 [Aphanomyces stellatus]VFT95551.1 Aste57867_18817 [Aphanomyces stellatus]
MGSVPTTTSLPNVPTLALADGSSTSMTSKAGNPVTSAADEERKRQRRKESEREWYLKHREDRLAKQRDYDARNRDRRLQQMKDYRTKHKEKQRAYKQDWYRRNRDAIRMKRTQRKVKGGGSMDDDDDDEDDNGASARGTALLSLLCDVALMT